MDDVLVGGKLAALVCGLTPFDVTGVLQLVDRGANRVLAFPIDIGKAGKGIIPILRQREHL